MQAPRVLGRAVAKQVGRRNASHSIQAQSTYNDLPSPQGNWQTQYDANQRKYNSHLVLGIAALGGTIVFGKVAGFFEFYNDIPQCPAKIESYKN